MLAVQLSESLRSADEGRAGDLPAEVIAIDETHVTKTPERSVSFNRDVHVKRIGESRQITPYEKKKNGKFPEGVLLD